MIDKEKLSTISPHFRACHSSFESSPIGLPLSKSPFRLHDDSEDETPKQKELASIIDDFSDSRVTTFCEFDNPIIYALATTCPIFHELMFHTKLIPLLSSYISLSFLFLTYHLDIPKTDVPSLPEYSNSPFLIPLLGRPLSDLKNPLLCKLWCLPIDKSYEEQHQKLTKAIERIFYKASGKSVMMESDILFCLCLMDRLLREGGDRGMPIKLKNATMIVVICLMLVNKFNTDQPMQNLFWSNLYSIPLKSLNKSELAVLSALDYRLTFEWKGRRFLQNGYDYENIPDDGILFDQADTYDKFLAFLSYYTPLE